MKALLRAFNSGITLDSVRRNDTVTRKKISIAFSFGVTKSPKVAQSFPV